MSNRRGVSLVEVLVAIFITGIGLLSLLALFPIGALSMAQAIRDSRASHAAQNAKNVCDMVNVCSDNRLMAALGRAPAPTMGLLPPDPPDPQGASYPIYVDPIGIRSMPTGASINVGVRPGLSHGMERLDPSLIASLSWPAGGGPGNPAEVALKRRHTLRWFSLLDDVTFDDRGVPDPSTGQVQREGRYSWAFTFKRGPAGGAPLATIVVYSQRSLQIDGATLQPLGERPYQAYYLPFNADGTPRNIVYLVWGVGTEAPSIRRGSWIMDLTQERIPSGVASPAYYGTMHGYFYRVVNTQEVDITAFTAMLASYTPYMLPPAGASSVLEVELQSNLRGFARPPAGLPVDIPQPYIPPGWSAALVPFGVAVVMENVIEVFETGPDT